MKKSYWTGGILTVLLLVISVSFYVARQADTQSTGSAVAQATAECPYTFVSWNIANLGKHNTGEQFTLMAKLLAHADIVAVQEVTARKGFGAKAVAQLAVELSRTGAAWDYIVSDATEPASSGVERYAFLFKKHIVSIDHDEAHLVGTLRDPIDREPFTSLFHLKGGKSVRVFTIHAVPTAKQPIREVTALGLDTEVRSTARAIIAGDFNLGPDATDAPLRVSGYTGHIRELTSLKKKVDDGKYLLMQYDNIYTKDVHVCRSGTIDYVRNNFAPVTDASLTRARELSDHLPVYVTFK